MVVGFAKATWLFKDIFRCQKHPYCTYKQQNHSSNSILDQTENICKQIYHQSLYLIFFIFKQNVYIYAMSKHQLLTTLSPTADTFAGFLDIDLNLVRDAVCSACVHAAVLCVQETTTA